jgi:hypothetical protein
MIVANLDILEILGPFFKKLTHCQKGAVKMLLELEGRFFKKLSSPRRIAGQQGFQATAREYLSISCQVSWSQMMAVSTRYKDEYFEEGI